MANDLSMYKPELWAQESLMVLEANMVLGSLVHRDFEAVVANFGDTVNSRKPASFTANNKGATANTTIQDATATNVPVVMNKHKEVTFQIFDIEATKSFKAMVDEYLRPAGIALANAVDVDVSGLYTDVSTNTITIAGDMTASSLADIVKKLNDTKVPMDQRRLVISSDQHAALLKDANFINAEKSGDQGTAVREASLGRKFGLDIYMDQNVTQVAGTPPTDKNLAFHRNAFALVTRPLSSAVPANTINVNMAAISYNGVGLRVVMGYDINKLATQVTIDILYGVKTLDQLLACLITTQV